MDALADLSLYLKTGRSENFFKNGIRKLLEFHNKIPVIVKQATSPIQANIEEIKKIAHNVASELKNYIDKAKSIIERIFGLGKLYNNKNIATVLDAENIDLPSAESIDLDYKNFNLLLFLNGQAETRESDYEPNKSEEELEI